MVIIGLMLHSWWAQNETDNLAQLMWHSYTVQSTTCNRFDSAAKALYVPVMISSEAAEDPTTLSREVSV